MPKRILIVNDERHLVLLMERYLRRAGYEVTTANNGVEALKKVKSEEPDMIILDDFMPRMSGHEVLEELRADPKTAEIPVIIPNYTLAERYRRLAGLPRPFNPKELLDFVKDLLPMRD